jgi:beta-lactamase superfamily II metal-dependent hydrolase
MQRFVIAILAVGLCATLAAATKTLDIYFIDVEGGQSTLVITPAGESMLVDAGYGARGGRDPDRIMAAIRDAGIERIDYLLITHFHNDHVGGVADLAARIPIGTFVDYGEPLGSDRMSTNGFRIYEPLRAEHPHLQPSPGDRLPLKGIDVDVISAGGTLLSKPLPGGGRVNDACVNVEDHVEDGTENYRSIGVMLQFGAFRFLNLGDLSGNTLTALACPKDLLGPVSAYLIAHHGDYDSNVPALYAALRPRAAIMNNGLRKGGSPDAFRTLRRIRGGLEMDLWQLHWSANQHADNAADDFIANLDDGETDHWLKLTATADGSFQIVNHRTGVTKIYPQKETH